MYRRASHHHGIKYLLFDCFPTLADPCPTEQRIVEQTSTNEQKRVLSLDTEPMMERGGRARTGRQWCWRWARFVRSFLLNQCFAPLYCLGHHRFFSIHHIFGLRIFRWEQSTCTDTHYAVGSCVCFTRAPTPFTSFIVALIVLFIIISSK